jgi:IS1 family transposase
MRVLQEESARAVAPSRRQNLSVRMECRRVTRLTNAFSKKLANLKASVALHYAH